MNFYLQLAIFLFCYMNIWFALSIRWKRNDIADIAWGLGFVLLGWTALILSEAFEPQHFLLTSLISLWGIRLSWYIFMRSRHKTEDFRYKQWRNDWQQWFYIRSWLQVYMLQGLLLYLIALPVIMYHHEGSASFSWLSGIGLTLWIFGFCFELISDNQLARFKRNPANKDKIMQSGLWKYSRHPNYFGEVTLWWGVYLFCADALPFWPAILSPLLITWLILFVSGIPMLEKKYAGREDFEAYKKTTNRFFPFPSTNILR